MKHIVILPIAILLLTACSKSATPSTDTPGVSVETEQSQQQGSTSPNTSQDQSQATTLSIEASDYAYTLKEITVSQGQDVTLNFTNNEGMHDFVIDELNVNSGVLEEGTSKSIKIPTDKPGTYEFYCSVGNHKQMGMVGTLIIE